MKNLLLLIFIILPCFLSAQKTDKHLTSKIQHAIFGFQGDIGIYVKDLKTGKVLSINADTIFPTASIVKVPIMTGVVAKMYSGEISYDSLFTYKDSLYYEGEDILGSFKNNEKIALKKLLMLMLTTSDNTASLWLQSIAGGGARINQILDSLGFKDTRVNSRVSGREANRVKYQWGQTTPKEMGMLFEKIYKKELFSDVLCERMMRMLAKNYWDQNEAISQIPPNIAVFSKNGCVNATRNEAMIVNAPHHPYIFCIFTKNNKDISWTHENEAWTLARKVSTLLWDYYGKK